MRPCKWYAEIKYSVETEGRQTPLKIDDSECTYRAFKAFDKDFVNGVRCQGDPNKCLIPKDERDF